MRDGDGKRAGRDKSAGEPRADLAEVLEAKAATLDENRPEALAKRKKDRPLDRAPEHRSLLDAGSLQEYGQLAKPAFKLREGPADGLVMGIGAVDGQSIAVAAYDYTVHAGTQATINHAKSDRLFHVIENLRLPFVFWTEGGGWRPHENNISARDFEETFAMMAKLSGQVPTLGIVAGRCFAGNANVAGLCDTLIATRKAALGMAGPPLVESALGIKLTPEELGPPEVHEASGAIDILVEDEARSNRCRKALSVLFPQGQSALRQADIPDVMALRDVVPENPRRAYDVRKVISGIADEGSVLELRPRFGRAAVVALIKVNGRPMGVLANQPMFLAGAMDSPACDKLARFIQLCDAHDIPMLYLCDTPGLMVGPEVRGDRAGAPQLAHPDRCGQRHHTVHDRGAAQGLWAWLLHDGLAAGAPDPAGRLADRRVRRHGP